jgi:hypothetical protein
VKLKPTHRFALLLIVAWQASVTQAQILNSERIEQTFGTYGIAVLFSDTALRLSNLYSIHDGRQVMRTFAIVGYPESVAASYAAEHQAILDGASIGSTFKDSGWDVIKTQHQFLGVSATPFLVEAMNVAPGIVLATHAYRLAIARGTERFDYATIIEIHHPDYLTGDGLRAIYGPASPPSEAMRQDMSRLLQAGQKKLTGLRYP